EIGIAAAVAVGVPLRVGALEITVVTLARPLVAGSVDLSLVEARALVRVAHEVIGRGDLLEFLLRLLVAGIEIRMQLFRQLAVGLGVLVLRRLRFHAQDSVGILAQVALLFCSLAAVKNASRWRKSSRPAGAGRACVRRWREASLGLRIR